jgi:hypothetical protein
VWNDRSQEWGKLFRLTSRHITYIASLQPVTSISTQRELKGKATRTRRPQVHMYNVMRAGNSGADHGGARDQIGAS